MTYDKSGAQAIAHVKRSKRDGTVQSHFLVADSYDRETDTLRIVDVPQLPYRVTREAFDRDWTGNALVARVESSGSRFTTNGFGRFPCRSCSAALSSREKQAHEVTVPEGSNIREMIRVNDSDTE